MSALRGFGEYNINYQLSSNRTTIRAIVATIVSRNHSFLTKVKILLSTVFIRIKLNMLPIMRMAYLFYIHYDNQILKNPKFRKKSKFDMKIQIWDGWLIDG